MASQFRSYDGRRTTLWMARLRAAMPFASSGGPVPCCCLPGVSLTEGTKLIALIQTTISAIYTMAMIISIVIYAIILNIPSKVNRGNNGDDNKDNSSISTSNKTIGSSIINNSNNYKVNSDDAFEDIQRRFGGGPLIFIVLSMAVVIGIACIVFHLYLYKAARLRNARKVNLWWRGFLLMSILNTTLFITVLVNGTKGLSIVELSEVIFDMYCLWVVRMFYLELARQTSTSSSSIDEHVIVGFAAPTTA